MDRRREIIEYAIPLMKQIFHKSCEEIQEWYNKEYSIIYQQVRNALTEVIEKTKAAQAAAVKSPVKYIVISSLRRGRRAAEWELRMESLDETLYLDEVDTGTYLKVEQLFPYMGRDLEQLYGVLRREFPRMQSYEMDAVADEYLEWYEAAACSLMKELMQGLCRLRLWEDIDIQGSLVVLFGEYMGYSQIIFEQSVAGKNIANSIEQQKALYIKNNSSLKYYLFQTDEGNRVPNIINSNDIINIDDLTLERINKIKTWNVMNMNVPFEEVYPDVIDFPFFAVSKECMELINLYESKIEYRCVKLWDKEKGKDKTYILPILNQVECLAETSQFNLSRSLLKKIVLDASRIGEHAIFRLPEFTRPYVIARLDFVESMIRRGAIGVSYMELECNG